ncbi:response regulator transcription factor [Alteromonas sp. 14N.309.X.WAT.G.H12]|uniref:response regulator transcription factor n=1 Tax=Alteromonas sp. 14N.309.X.WAT.G.H12 TaxID=3120824 RepID=UPI002FCF2269
MHILLVDDHAVVRQGYSALLSMMLPDATLHEAENARQAMTCLNQHPVDVVILDINLEQASGLNVAPRLLNHWPRLKIIFFSMFEEASIVNRAMHTGACGYISKRCRPEIMLEAVKAVMAGKTYIEHELAIDLASYAYNEKKDIFDQLTRREFDVFMGVAKGQKRSRIAQDLNISDKTVSNAITQLKSKLQVKTSTELVHLAIDNGYLKIAS